MFTIRIHNISMSFISFVHTIGLQLQLSLQEGTLSLLLYNYPQQTFYSGKFTSQSLPQSVLSLYADIQHIYFYLLSLSEKSQNYLWLTFQAPFLNIKDMICGGTVEILSQIPLELVQIGERMQLLRKRLQKLKIQQKAVIQKVRKQDENIRQNERICKQINKQLIIREARCKQIKKRTQILNKKEHELRNEIKQWKDKLQLVNNELECYLENNFQPANPIFKFTYLPFQNNPFFQFFHKNGNTIVNQIEPYLIYSQIVAKDPLPTYAIWTVSFKIITCKYGMTIGLTGKTNREKQTSFSQENAICFCTRTSSTYTNGIRKSFTKVALSKGDTICLKIDRQTSFIFFLLNGQQISEIQLPPSLKETILYPFIEISHKDSISLAE